MYIKTYKDTVYQTNVLDNQDILRCFDGECTIISTKMNKPKQLCPDSHWRTLLKWDFVKEEVNKNFPIDYKQNDKQEMKNENKESPPVSLTSQRSGALSSKTSRTK